MASLALHHGVRAGERKPVLVILNVSVGDLPAFRGMATFAIPPELAAMDIGVAIGTMSTYILEDQRRVALGAAYVLVHSPQRIAGTVVIELGDGAGRLPARVRVTVLTRNGEGAMGTGYFGPRGGAGRCRRGYRGLRLRNLLR